MHTQVSGRDCDRDRDRERDITMMLTQDAVTAWYQGSLCHASHMLHAHSCTSGMCHGVQESPRETCVVGRVGFKLW
jgi:hypothetical protein